MAEFMIGISAVHNTCTELERIVQSLQKLEERLDTSVRHRNVAGARNIARIQGRVLECERELANEKNKISDLGNILYDISELYAGAEKKIESELMSAASLKLDGVDSGVGMNEGISVEKVENIMIRLKDYFGTTHTLTGDEEMINLLGPYACIFFATGIDNDSIASKYGNVFSEYIGRKIERYIGEINQADNVAEVVVDGYDWFMKDVYGDLNKYISVYNDLELERTFTKPNVFGKMGKFFETLSTCGVLVDCVKEVKQACESGNWMEAYKNIGFDVYKTVVKKGSKILDKIDNLKYLGVDKTGQSILLDTIISMPQTWVAKIEEYAKNNTGTAGTIVTEVVVGSLVENAAKAVNPIYTATTALTYPVIDGLCEMVGYDLSGAYERSTGKTGIEAVWAAQKELWVDIVYEGTKKKIAKGVDWTYDAIGNAGTWVAETAQKGWNNFTSGLKRVFGG